MSAVSYAAPEKSELAPPDEALSPELVLVAPPEVAEVARQLLPDPEPLDEWLRRVRSNVAKPAEQAPDWEFPAIELHREIPSAALFTALCSMSAILPVVLLLATR
jgi:hypothetical protein